MAQKSKLSMAVIGKANEPGQIVNDTQTAGLYLRVANDGSKTLFYRFRLPGENGMPGKQVNRKVADVRTLESNADIGKVRRRCEAMREEGRETGADPRAKRERSETFDQLVDRYIAEALPARGKPYAPSVEAAAKRNLGIAKKMFRGRDIADITPGDIDAFKAKVKAKIRRDSRATSGGNSAANMALNFLIPFFKWARGERYVTWLVTDDVTRSEENGPREQVMNRAQRAAFWAAIDVYEHGPKPAASKTDRAVPADLIRALVLTGARKREACAMRWEDLNLDAGKWFKPKTKTSPKGQTVYLIGEAVEFFKALRAKRDAGPGWMRNSAYVFPSRRGRGVSDGFFSTPEAAWNTILEIAGLQDKGLVLHDLRAGLVTALAEAGHPFAKICAITGHSPKSKTIEDVYMRVTSDADAQMQGIMQGIRLND